MFDLFKKKPKTKDAAEYRSVMVTRADRRSARGKVTNLDQLTSQSVQWIGICADLIASVSSCSEFKLYVTASEGRLLRRCGVQTRKVKRHQARFLAGEGPRLTGKAASFSADALDDVEEVLRSDIMRVMNKPAAPSLTTATHLREFIAKSMVVTGNCWLYGLPKDRMILPMMPQLVRLDPSDQAEGLIRTYLYGREENNLFAIPADEVLHLKYRAGFEPYLGRGPVHNIFNEARLFAEATVSEIARQENMSRPDYLATGNFGSEDRRQQIEEILESKFQGSSNSGQVLVTEALDIKTLGFSPKDIEAIQTFEHARELILAGMGVPESLVKLNDANLASSLTGNVQFLSQTIVPLLNTICEQLGAHMLPMWGLDDNYMILFDNPVPEDREREQQTVTSLVQTGLITPREARMRLGIDDDPEAPIENADALNRLYVNGAELGDDAGFGIGGGFGLPSLGGSFGRRPEPEASQTPVPQNPKVEESALNGAQIASLISIAEQVSLGTLTREAGRAIALASFPGIAPEKIGNIFDNLIEGQRPPEPETVTNAYDFAKHYEAEMSRYWPKPCGHRTKDDDRQTPLDPDLEILIDAQNGFASDLEGWYSSAIEMIGSDGKLPASSLNILDHIIDRNLNDFVRLGGVLGIQAVTGEDSPSFTPSPTVLSDYKPVLTSSISQTFEGTIGRVIRDGIEGGETIAQITARLREELPDLPATSAARIARTETMRAVEAGALEGWKETGIEKTEWILAAGACPICQKFYSELQTEGRTSLPIGEFYAKAGRRVNYISETGRPSTFVFYQNEPGARTHPNNRSSVRAVIDTSEEQTRAVGERMLAIKAAVLDWRPSYATN